MGIKSMTEALEEMKKVLDEKTKKEDASNDKSDDGEGLDKVDPKAAKKKFADRKDKDLDNDGDTDSSDEYLHKRRKAIGKSISDAKVKEAEGDDEEEVDTTSKKKKVKAPADKGIEDDEAEVEMNPKLSQKGNKKLEAKESTAVISPQYKEGMKAAKDKKPYDSNPYKSGKKKLDWSKGHNEFRAKKLNAQNEEVELDESEVEMNPKLSQKGNKKLEAKESTISKIREKLLGVLRTEAKQPNDSGTPSEAEDDTLPPARAKKKNDDHVVEVDDTEEKGHDDASKAGRAGPSKKPRGNDNPAGDTKIVKAGTPVKEDTGEMAEPFVTPTQSFKKMIDAYNDVLK